MTAPSGYRDEALRDLAASSLTRGWTSNALHAYVAGGLYDLPDGSGVALKCPAFLEGSVYELLGPCESFAHLPDLDERVSLLWVMPRKLSVFGGSEENARELVWRRKGNIRNVLLECGHLVNFCSYNSMNARTKAD
jgi:hypothetical protein